MSRALVTTLPSARAVRTAVAWLACLLALALWPGVATALTIGSFESSRTEDQAGAHPSLTASFSFGGSGDTDTVDVVQLGTPAGFFLSPDAVPKCSAASFAAFECPSSTQVGLITIRADHAGDASHLLGTAPVYALVAATGEIARLGFIAPVVNGPIEVPVTVRSASDYGLDLRFEDLPQASPLTGAALTLWGIPAEALHDSQRFAAGSPGAPAGCPGVDGTSCIVGPEASSLPLRPLLHNPTSCIGPLTSTLDVTTYQHPGEFLSATTTDLAGTNGCDRNGFNPMLFAELTTAQTRSPSGLTLELRVNDDEFFSPYGVSQSQIKFASIALPSGLALDADAAGDLITCTNAQFRPGTMEPIACPAGSQVGTFSMAVAGLETPLAGTTYFGTREPSGAYRLFLTASNTSIGTVKLIGLLQTDGDGGPVTVSLPDLPQLPLEELQLKLAAEPGLLVTPIKCGVYEAKGTLSPWSSSGAPSWLTASKVSLTSTGPDAGPCPGPATDVELVLSPASLLADGSSTSLATATVTDANGISVPGEDLAFSSTDPGQQIGTVTDNEDGTYTARITASTTVGTKTIAATDASVEPPVLGSANLTQLALPSPPAAQPQVPLFRARPVATFAAKPRRRTADRTPTFRFVSSKPRSTFSCRLDKQPFRRCTSPKTLPNLGFGHHSFSVRATDPTGTTSAVATYGFTIRRPVSQRSH